VGAGKKRCKAGPCCFIVHVYVLAIDWISIAPRPPWPRRRRELATSSPTGGDAAGVSTARPVGGGRSAARATAGLANAGARAHQRQRLARLWVPAPMAHRWMRHDFFCKRRKWGRGDWESNPGCPWELTSVARRDGVTFEAWTELR